MRYQKIFLIGFSLFVSSTLWAQTPQELVQDFVKAVQSKDAQTISASKIKLSADPEAVEYLKKHKPYYYTFFQMKGISERINGLKQSYGGSGEIEVAPTNSVPSVKHGSPDNNSLKNLQPTLNQNLAPNRVTVSNQEQVQRSSNQSRPSNQERIRSRQRPSRR